MGRKEDRRLKKLRGESLRKQKATGPALHPVMIGDTRYIPVQMDNVSSSDANQIPDMFSPQEFQRMSDKLSDEELNRILYQDARTMVEEGTMPDWPSDDFGTVMWFAWSFMTPEMKEAFPVIAQEYLAHHKTADKEEGSSRGTQKADDHVTPAGGFRDIPYSRLAEKTWDDAFYFRILLMMLFSARNGSAYSRNFLLSLYKVYYKQEYNKLKRLDTLTFLDVLEFHDEECLRKGYSSGHTQNGTLSLRNQTIEKQKHEPGWTRVYHSDGKKTARPEPRADEEIMATQ